MITMLGEVGRVSKKWLAGDSLTLNVPITVDVPASTPAAAVHLLLGLGWSQQNFSIPTNPPVDNVAVPKPAASWGMLKHNQAGEVIVPATSNPFVLASPFLGAEQEPSGTGVVTAVYLGYVKDAVPAGRVVSVTWPASDFTWRGGIVYAVRGIAAGATLWPTTGVVPVRPCTFFNSVVGDVNNIWSAGVGSGVETQTWLGEGLFFSVCAHQAQPMPSFLGFSSPTMVNDGNLAGLGRTGGPDYWFPVFDPGGGVWFQHAYHAGDITTALDINVTSAPGTSPDWRGAGGGLIDFIGGPGLP